MMLEISPELTFGVLSPAFRGNEGEIALEYYSGRGCTFLSANRCELFGTDYRPLECRFCHHSRHKRGMDCHNAIESDWMSPRGQQLVIAWCRLTGLFTRHKIVVKDQLSKKPEKQY